MLQALRLTRFSSPVKCSQGILSEGEVSVQFISISNQLLFNADFFSVLQTSYLNKVNSTIVIVGLEASAEKNQCYQTVHV
jgi:hypothetical protein